MKTIALVLVPVLLVLVPDAWALKYALCTGASAALDEAECAFWQDLVDATSPWHQSCSRTDPCGCKFLDAIAVDCGSDGKHIRSLRVSGQCCKPGHSCNFHKCMMNGPLPPSIGNLTMLASLRLNNNDLQGTIPRELAQLSSLTDIDMDSNNFSGIVPPLPFSQYKTCEFLGNGNFACPLPPNANLCRCCGDIPGVTCYDQAACRAEMAAQAACRPPACKDCYQCLVKLNHAGKIHCNDIDIANYCNGKCARTNLAAGPLSISVDGKPVTAYVGVSGGTAGDSTSVSAGDMLVIKNPTGPRSYLVNNCIEDEFQAGDFLKVSPLSGHGPRGRISFLVNLSGTTCGCNAAVYLTSMPAIGRDGKPNQTAVKDFSCDSGGVYESCPEIDLMEANMHAFSATVHRCVPSTTVPGHYESCDGDGCSINTKHMPDGSYGPGPAYTIDTTRAFRVNTTFSTTVSDSTTTVVAAVGHEGGNDTTTAQLTQIDTVLSQGPGRLLRMTHNDTSCGQRYVASLDTVVRAGMTMVVSNWGDRGMGWLDSPPCPVDARCGSNSLRVGAVTVESL